jgi:hypothetical protein
MNDSLALEIESRCFSQPDRILQNVGREFLT